MGHLFIDTPAAIAENTHSGPAPVVLIFREDFLLLLGRFENHEAFERRIMFMFFASKLFRETLNGFDLLIFKVFFKRLKFTLRRFLLILKQNLFLGDVQASF